MEEQPIGIKVIVMHDKEKEIDKKEEENINPNAPINLKDNQLSYHEILSTKSDPIDHTLNTEISNIAMDEIIFYSGYQKTSFPKKLLIIFFLILISPLILVTGICVALLFSCYVMLNRIYHCSKRAKLHVPPSYDINWTTDSKHVHNIYILDYPTNNENNNKPKAIRMPSAPGSVDPKEMNYNVKVDYKTFYLKMRDGVRLAVDVHLPFEKVSKKQKLPCIFLQSRYHRSINLTWPLKNFVNKGIPVNPLGNAYIRKFLAAGYVVVVVDVRGTGASYGTLEVPWSTEEQDDSLEMLDWIVAQTWSNGNVGLWGVSYEGTSAFFTMSHCHPAVKACVPMFMIWDAYHDIACPGGIPQHQFAARWQNYNNAIDKDRYSDIGGILAKLLISGVTRASSNENDFENALKGHSGNWNARNEVGKVIYRDSISYPSNLKIGFLSAYKVVEGARCSNVPTLFYSGWYDCTARGALQGYVQIPNSSLIMGPWTHAGVQHMRPDSYGSFTLFHHAKEVVSFFDRHLKSSNVQGVTSLSRKNTQVEIEESRSDLGWAHFYCCGENTWNHSKAWPLQGSFIEKYYFSKNSKDQNNNLLCKDINKVLKGKSSFDVCSQKSINGVSRWVAMVESARVMNYHGWERCNHLTFTSHPLEEDLKITGIPVISLAISSSDTDADLFVYLVSISPHRSNPNYITEGHFRASHRKETSIRDFIPELPYPNVPHHSFIEEDVMPLIPGQVAQVRFDLLPASYLFKKGHRIRICISGQDDNHFVSNTSNGRSIKIHYDSIIECSISLPVVPILS